MTRARATLPTCRGYPTHWGQAGHRAHIRAHLRAVAFLQGAELMGSDHHRRDLHDVRQDLDAAHQDLHAARGQVDDTRTELATARGALEVTQDELQAARQRERHQRTRAELARHVCALTDRLLADPATAGETTVPMPRVSTDSEVAS